MADALLGINGQNRQWDGICDERASRNETGWAFEVRIPFRTLNFSPNSRRLTRYQKRRDEALQSDDKVHGGRQL